MFDDAVLAPLVATTTLTLAVDPYTPTDDSSEPSSCGLAAPRLRGLLPPPLLSPGPPLLKRLRGLRAPESRLRGLGRIGTTPADAGRTIPFWGGLFARPSM